jgi:hypothetical protein
MFLLDYFPPIVFGLTVVGLFAILSRNKDKS